MIYTIQNELGDRGFIQKIHNGKEIDEIIGFTSDFDNKYRSHYIIISEMEYNTIKWLHEMLNETGDLNYQNALELLINATIEKNTGNEMG